MSLTCQRRIPSAWIVKIPAALLWWIVLAVLFCSSLSAGSSRPLPLFLTRLLILAGSLIQLPRFFWEENYWADFPDFSAVPLSLFGAFFLTQTMQYVLGVTVNSHATFSFLIQLAVYFLFFILCVKSLGAKEGIEKLIFFLAILVLLVTMWGISERFLGRALFRKALLDQDSFGPFVNPNHYSAFAGLLLPLFGAHLHGRFRQGSTVFDSRVLFFIFLIVLAIAGCFLSGSRSGAMLIPISMTIYFAVLGMKRPGKKAGFTALIMIAGMLAIMKPLGLGSVFRTFSWESLLAAIIERAQVSKEALGIFFQYSVLGSGLGTFSFISSKTISVLADSVQWNHAHNDYVELLAETGALGFLLFMGSLVAAFFYGLRRLRGQKIGTQAILTQAAFAVFNIGILEVTDFPIRIPSIALIFILQLSFFFAARQDKKPLLLPLRNTARYALAAIFLSVVIFLGGWSFRDYEASRLAQSNENRLQNLEEAVGLQPRNAEYWYQYGQVVLAEKKDSELFQKTARNAFQEAVFLSPTYSRYWFALGRAEYQAGDTKKALASLEKAAFLAPYKSGYWLHLIAVTLEQGGAARTDEEKKRHLEQVKRYYEHLKQLKNFPNKDEQNRWMGEVYAQKFEQYQLHD